MSVPVRLSVDQARAKSMVDEALLVCAYDNDDQFHQNHLEGAIAWQAFETQLPDLAKDALVIVYCA